MKIKILKETYKILKTTVIPTNVDNGEFFSITKTNEENSIVLDHKIRVSKENIISEDCGWKILKIDEVLDFSLVGILSKISEILAKNKISIFAISTFNTDYILIKDEKLNKAKEVLAKNKYNII